MNGKTKISLLGLAGVVIMSGGLLVGCGGSKTFKINYNFDNGGNEIDKTQDVKNGSDFELYTPTRTGYKFLGWELENGTAVEDGVFEFGENITLIAVWEKLNFEVSFDLNEGTQAGTEFDETEAAYDSVFVIPAETPVKEGFEFAGWLFDGIVYNKGAQLSIGTKNISFVAQWIASDETAYKVVHKQQNIENDEYTIVTEDTQNLTGTTGESVTPAVKTYTGFTSPSTQTETILADGSLEIVYLYNRTLHDVTFVVDENKATVDGDLDFTGVKYGATITAPTVTAEAGYEFTGWDETVETEVTTGATYTAAFTIKTYTIAYNLDGGALKAEETNPTSYNIESELITLNNPEKTGYTFGGWFKNAGFTGNAVETIAKGSTGNLDLHVQWIPSDETAYKVVHKQQNIENDEYTIVTEDTQNLTGTTGESVTPAVKTYTGFTSPSTQTETILADGSLEIVYLYNRTLHDVTFVVDENKATVDGDLDFTGVKYGATITAPTVTAEAGYEFTGWDETVETEVTTGATYTAAFTIKTYTIAYNLDGGALKAEETNPTSYNIESELITLNNPEKTGYTFGGWFKNDQFTGDSVKTISTGSTGNIDLFAKWTADEYTVTFIVDDEKDDYKMSNNIGELVGNSMLNVTSVHENMNVTFAENATLPTFTEEELSVLISQEGEETAKIFDFVGWFTKDGTDGDWGEKITGENWSIANNTTLYAKFENIKVNVVLNKSGGTFSWGDNVLNAEKNKITILEKEYDFETDSEENQIICEFPYNRTAVLNSVYPSLSRDGFETSSEWGYYYHDDNLSDLADQFDKGVFNLYVKWATQSGCSVEFNAGEGTFKDENEQAYKKELLKGPADGQITVDIETPERENYTFKGWTDGETVYENGDKINIVRETTTFNAVWEGVESTVTFDAQGGTVTPAAQDVQFGKSTTLPTPTKGGLTFKGWYTKNGTGGDWGELVSQTSVWAYGEDITVYAQYEAPTATIDFKIEGREFSKDIFYIDDFVMNNDIAGWTKDDLTNSNTTAVFARETCEIKLPDTTYEFRQTLATNQFFEWRGSDGNFYPVGSTAQIDGDCTFTPVIHTLSLKIDTNGSTDIRRGICSEDKEFSELSAFTLDSDGKTDFIDFELSSGYGYPSTEKFKFVFSTDRIKINEGGVEKHFAGIKLAGANPEAKVKEFYTSTSFYKESVEIECFSIEFRIENLRQATTIEFVFAEAGEQTVTYDFKEGEMFVDKNGNEITPISSYTVDMDDPNYEPSYDFLDKKEQLFTAKLKGTKEGYQPYLIVKDNATGQTYNVFASIGEDGDFRMENCSWGGQRENTFGFYKALGGVTLSVGYEKIYEIEIRDGEMPADGYEKIALSQNTLKSLLEIKTRNMPYKEGYALVCENYNYIAFKIYDVNGEDVSSYSNINIEEISHIVPNWKEFGIINAGSIVVDDIVLNGKNTEVNPVIKFENDGCSIDIINEEDLFELNEEYEFSHLVDEKGEEIDQYINFENYIKIDETYSIVEYGEEYSTAYRLIKNEGDISLVDYDGEYNVFDDNVFISTDRIYEKAGKFYEGTAEDGPSQTEVEFKNNLIQVGSGSVWIERYEEEGVEKYRVLWEHRLSETSMDYGVYKLSNLDDSFSVYQYNSKFYKEIETNVHGWTEVVESSKIPDENITNNLLEVISNNIKATYKKSIIIPKEATLITDETAINAAIEEICDKYSTAFLAPGALVKGKLISEDEGYVQDFSVVSFKSFATNELGEDFLVMPLQVLDAHEFINSFAEGYGKEIGIVPQMGKITNDDGSFTYYAKAYMPLDSGYDALATFEFNTEGELVKLGLKKPFEGDANADFITEKFDVISNDMTEISAEDLEAEKTAVANAFNEVTDSTSETIDSYVYNVKLRLYQPFDMDGETMDVMDPKVENGDYEDLIASESLKIEAIKTQFIDNEETTTWFSSAADAGENKKYIIKLDLEETITYLEITLNSENRITEFTEIGETPFFQGIYVLTRYQFAISTATV